jgi:mannitol-1-phosphate 5-dehydrogenase
VSAETIVIWGAGRIGRGFLAELFADAGYRIVLVDQSEALVERLRGRGQYTVVHAMGADRREYRAISGYGALTTAEGEEVAAAVASADLMAVAVFPKDMVAVAQEMVPGLLRRREERPGEPLDIILCANVAHPGPQFRSDLAAALPLEARSWAESQVGIVESLVIRMVAEPPAEELARHPLLVWSNGYGEFPVERRAFRCGVPPVPALRPVEDMRAEETRKLYTYNTFHAALAYLGALRGHESVVDCLGDPWMREIAEGALREAALAVQVAYGYGEDEMVRWIEGVVVQTDNAALRDTVARFGRNPRRKLRRGDRLVGPLLLAHKHGLETPNLVLAVGAALLYEDAGDAGACHVHQQVQDRGVEEAVRELCGLGDAEAGVIGEIALATRRLPLESEWAGRAEQAYRLGFAYEQRYHGCGQCVLAAVHDAAGLFDEVAFHGAFEAATGLAGGVGLCGDGTCSALTGGALALGLYSPRRRAQFDGDRDNKYRAYDLIQRLRERVLSAYSSTRCHDIHRHELGRAFDLRDPAERQAFEDAGAHVSKCTGVVARAAQWTVEIIGAEEVRRALGSEGRAG